MHKWCGAGWGVKSLTLEGHAPTDRGRINVVFAPFHLVTGVF